MSQLRNRAIIIVCFFGVIAVNAESINESHNKAVPTHADAAIILTKYSGLFDRYVPADATLNDCVSFLNEHGVYFGLMEVVKRAQFTMTDCARTMGQMELVFTGEATYLAGKVILPKGIDSWEEFCILNNVDYVKGYEAIMKSVQGAVKLDH